MSKCRTFEHYNVEGFQIIICCKKTIKFQRETANETIGFFLTELELCSPKKGLSQHIWKVARDYPQHENQQ